MKPLIVCVVASVTLMALSVHAQPTPVPPATPSTDSATAVSATGTVPTPDPRTFSFAEYETFGDLRRRQPVMQQALALAREKNAAADVRSDAAWARALPLVMAGNTQGRPYIPWAAQPADLPQAKIPAFPGAEGGGMYSFGGRGGRVLVVTNLDDRGPGSFREAVESGGPRIVVFNVAGIIRLSERIRIRAPYITIAGNTAPGDGICIANETVMIDTHDVVIRHLRFRRGQTWVGDMDDAVGGHSIGNIILDHVSCSWALDENLSLYRHVYQPPAGGAPLKLPTVNVTIQHSIISESLARNGSTIGGHNSTFHHNLWANNTGRNPSIGMDGDFTFVNNVLYNWRDRTVDGGDEKSYFTILNNYYKPGPMTPRDQPIAHRVLKAEARRGKPLADIYGRAYVAGNVVEGNARVTKDNWEGGVEVTHAVPASDKAALIAALRIERPYRHAPLTITSAVDAYAHVLANAGATLPRRDAVDRRVIENTRTGTATHGVGEIRDVAQVGGYPDYKGTPHIDTDADGLPDAWETRHGLDPRNPADATRDRNGDGYANIEDYINGLDPRAPPRDWTDLKNNRDPRQLAAVP